MKTNTTPTPTLQSLLPQYRSYLADELRRSHLTIVGYCKDLRAALAWLSTEAGRPAEPSDLTLPQLRAYQASRSHDKPNTLNRRITALVSFCAYLVREHLLADNPAQQLSRPEVPESLPKFLTEAQAAALMEAPGRSTKALRCANDAILLLRDEALLEVFYAVGARLSEVVNLDLEDVIFAGKEVTFRLLGKGNKERMVSRTGIVVAALQKYLDRRGELQPCCPALFVSYRFGNRLDPGSAREVVYKWAATIGVKVHPHLLRHTFATHTRWWGADLKTLQAMLGHASLATTGIYAHVDKRDSLGARHPRGEQPLALAPPQEPVVPPPVQPADPPPAQPAAPLAPPPAPAAAPGVEPRVASGPLRRRASVLLQRGAKVLSHLANRIGSPPQAAAA